MSKISRPRINIKKQEKNYNWVFVAQIVAYFLMVIGFFMVIFLVGK